MKVVIIGYAAEASVIFIGIHLAEVQPPPVPSFLTETDVPCSLAHLCICTLAHERIKQPRERTDIGAAHKPQVRHQAYRHHLIYHSPLNHEMSRHILPFPHPDCSLSDLVKLIILQIMHGPCPSNSTVRVHVAISHVCGGPSLFSNRYRGLNPIIGILC